MSQSPLAQNYFWIRRLHSLTGIAPIGMFVIVHLFTNAYSWHPEAFNKHVKDLNETPLIEWIEYLGVILPIAFHGLLGLWMAVRMDVNQPQYTNFRNWMYFLQRISGVVVLAFIIFHLIQFRFGMTGAFKDVGLPAPGFPTRGLPGQHYDPYGAIKASLTSYSWVAPLYLVGIVATAFHLSNGVWSFCVTWGITLGRRSQLLMSYATMGLFLLVAAFGIYAFTGFLWAPLQG